MVHETFLSDANDEQDTDLRWRHLCVHWFQESMH